MEKLEKAILRIEFFKDKCASLDDIKCGKSSKTVSVSNNNQKICYEKEVTEALKEYNPTDGSSRKPIEGYKSEWTKARRNFTKSKIVKDEPKEESKDK